MDIPEVNIFWISISGKKRKKFESLVLKKEKSIIFTSECKMPAKKGDNCLYVQFAVN